MEGTRLDILLILQRSPYSTVEDITSQLDLAPATVRRHLDILQRDRMVAYVALKNKVGRPEHAFYLTETGQETLPKDYGRLLALLLEELGKLSPGAASDFSGKDALELALRRVSEREWAERARTMGGGQVEERLKALATLLSERGFRPVVEREGDAIRFRLLNCPFRTAALVSDLVCSFDRHLLTSVLGQEVIKEDCIRSGDPGCCYRTLQPLALPGQAPPYPLP
ncbi:MAG: ArsR family transcriptional regulator [Chloroflexi bacterium]|nr:ArsR family transcriptional regulator [Chloroflexota bacterium]